MSRTLSRDTMGSMGVGVLARTSPAGIGLAPDDLAVVMAGRIALESIRPPLLGIPGILLPEIAALWDTIGDPLVPVENRPSNLTNRIVVVVTVESWTFYPPVPLRGRALPSCRTLVRVTTKPNLLETLPPPEQEPLVPLSYSPIDPICPSPLLGTHPFFHTNTTWPPHAATNTNHRSNMLPSH